MILRFFILLALLAFGATPAEAGTISLETSTTATVSETEVLADVTIYNAGDQPATQVQVTAVCRDSTVISPLKLLLEPGQSWTVRLPMHPNLNLPGVYPAIITVDFQDTAGYPFTALSYTTFPHRQGEAPRIIVREGTAEIQGEGPLRVELISDEDVPRRVNLRLVPPREIKVQPSSLTLDIGPRGKREVIFHLKNLTGQPGATCPILAVVESEADGRHLASVAQIVVRLDQVQAFLKKNQIAGLLVLGFLVLLVLIGQAWRLESSVLNTIIRAALWVLIYTFLLSYLDPALLIQDISVTGGDLPGHFDALVYFREHLLPRGRLVGWQPGHYAGYPQFQMYFPLTFLIMAGLSLAIPLTVAFKLVTLLGVLTLPWAAYRFLKNLGQSPPVPDLGAAFMLAFLFNEANSAWGGNITSTLAGEFSYAFSLSFSLIYLGRLYRDVPTGRGPVGNAILLAAVGLSHGYTLLFCVVSAAFFLLSTREWLKRLIYILKVNLLAFCFMGFWIAPLLIFSPYTTPFNFIWVIEGWRQVFPVIIQPYLLLAGLAAAAGWFSPERSLRQVTWFSLFLLLVAAAFYASAYRLGVVDVRFVPFGQITLVMMGAIAAGRLVSRLKAPYMAALALALATTIWAAHHERVILRWSAWSFAGWEEKSLWPAFKGVTDHLAGNFSQPRVVYEHGGITEAVGTIRAFESLPYFAGRATLEGSYIQACLSAPFVFYLQSLVSQTVSAPLTQYNYGRFDLSRARPRLELFNVGQYVTVTAQSRRLAEKTPGYVLEKEFPPFAVFRLTENSGRYVVSPHYRPVLARSTTPKPDSFAWFRWADLDVPLVLTDKVSQAEIGLFAGVLNPDDLPRGRLNTLRQELPIQTDLKESVREDEIIITGARPGQPLWIRVSYHPGWLVEGADRVWRTAPSFMLVFPTGSRVRLYFGRTWPDYLGLALTIFGFLWALAELHRARSLQRRRSETDDLSSTRTDLSFRSEARNLSGGMVESRDFSSRPRAASRNDNRWLFLRNAASELPDPRPGWRSRLIRLVLLVGLGGTGLYLVFAVGHRDPASFLNRGQSLAEAGDYDQARRVFLEGLDRFPVSSVVDRTQHHLALTYFQQGDFEEARRVWGRLETDFPESRYLPEAMYHMGLCHLRLSHQGVAKGTWQDVMTFFPDSPWSTEAEKRLKELRLTEPKGSP